MSLNIGTNFNYQGEDFLDSRQGAPKSTSDLKNWTIPVPLGFEACLDGTWYMWMGLDSADDPVLGHWRKRPMGEGGGNYDEAIDKLMRAVFKLEFTVSGGGTYESGTTGVKPTISWIGRKESATVYPMSSQINPGTGWINLGNSYSYTPANAISTNTTYNIKANFGDDGERTGSTSVVFKLKKYLGSVSESIRANKILNDSVSTIKISELINSPNGNVAPVGWADTWKNAATPVNCFWNSVGAYPIYIIPASLYESAASSFYVRAGDFNYSDYTVKIKNLINSPKEAAQLAGQTITPDSYAFIVFNVKQTANPISIQIGA